MRALVKDIWDLRMAKLRKSTDLMVSEQESHALVSSLFIRMWGLIFPIMVYKRAYYC